MEKEDPLNYEIEKNFDGFREESTKEKDGNGFFGGKINKDDGSYAIDDE